MILDLGLIDYEEAYRVQKELVARRRLGEIDDTIILAEHRPVFTIGRSGSRANLLADEKLLDQRGIKVLSVDRGGDITFHGPGQIVAYPVIDLKPKFRDLHRYMRCLEEAVIVFMGSYSVAAVRAPGKTGVWALGRKVASIGIGASDWVTYHGVSININVDLTFFSMIHPCGMKDVEMDSLGRILGKSVDMDEARRRFLSSFNRIFDFGYARPTERYSSTLA
jgi:lipoyl(octanoyl) transferase